MRTWIVIAVAVAIAVALWRESSSRGPHRETTYRGGFARGKYGGTFEISTVNRSGASQRYTLTLPYNCGEREVSLDVVVNERSEYQGKPCEPVVVMVPDHATVEVRLWGMGGTYRLDVVED